MELQEWKFIQSNADQILIGGLNNLNEQKYLHGMDFTISRPGNYLISLDDKPVYIGEGKILSNRIKQQFNPKTSTFYKNYLRSDSKANFPIDSFSIKAMETKIGRKEIEEMGIVNLMTKLNRFQLNKRSTYELVHNEFWNDLQDNSEKFLELSDQVIMKGNFTNWTIACNERTPGIYIVKNKSGDLIYIGESSDIYDRHYAHSKTTYFSALRRHIGTEILGFELIDKNGNGKKKYLDPAEDHKVTRFLNSCSAVFHPISIGRYEIEEFLIKKYRPLLNRKDNQF